MPDSAVRIAMWSGPRNISTAMMRSWGSRADTYVTDEPYYAHYLRHVEVDHPGKNEVLASQQNDWRKVAEWLTGPAPEGKAIWYQKHMAQHFLPGMAGAWMAALRHALLIREPQYVIASFVKVVGKPVLRDTGFPQLLDLYRRISAMNGRPPPVVDSANILRDPRQALSRLCEALGVAFDAAMLHWHSGARETDGVWAKYWYHAVESSTGFQPYRPHQVELSPDLQQLYEECLPYYEELAAHQITLN